MIQVTLPGKDVATGLGIILLTQTFGGALLVSVAQAVSLEKIGKTVKTIDPIANLNPHSVPAGSSTSLMGSPHAHASIELQAVYGRGNQSDLSCRTHICCGL